MFNKLLYSTREVLQLIPISNTSLYRAIANGEIDSSLLGRRRVFTGQALTDFVTRITGPAAKRGAR